MVNVELQKQLIHVLLSKDQYFEDERSDAAMALRNFETKESLDALIQVGSDVHETRGMQNTCGESIAIIWEKTHYFEKKVYNQLTPSAQIEIDALELQKFDNGKESF